MDTISQIPIRIIREQELVIGPLAWDEAKKVAGLMIDPSHTSVSLSGDSKDIINRLVARYERLFGKASHEVCREAVQDIVAGMSSNEVPESLK